MEYSERETQLYHISGLIIIRTYRVYRPTSYVVYTLTFQIPCLLISSTCTLAESNDVSCPFSLSLR